MKNKTNFRIRLNLFCSQEKYMPREALKCVYFKDGFAYATDAHILIKHKLSFEDCINCSLLEDKFISSTVFAQILKADAIEATEDGILADGNLFPYAENVGVFPNVEIAIPSIIEQVEQIVLNPKELNTILRAFPLNRLSIKFVFCGTDKATKIIFQEFEDTTVIIMPKKDWK